MQYTNVLKRSTLPATIAFVVSCVNPVEFQESERTSIPYVCHFGCPPPSPASPMAFWPGHAVLVKLHKIVFRFVSLGFASFIGNVHLKFIAVTSTKLTASAQWTDSADNWNNNLPGM